MTAAGRTRPTAARVAAVILAALLASLSSCYSYQHYTEDPTALDYMFFGAIDDDEGSSLDGGPDSDALPGWNESESWQIFYLWGLMPWYQPTPTFAAEALALHKLGEPEEQIFTIETRKSVLNVLVEGGLSIIPIVGFVQPFFLNWRSVHVRARPLHETASR